MSVEFKHLGKNVSIAGHTENDWIYKSIRKHLTFYEIDLLRYIRYVLGNDKGFLLDVGANIGNHSVYFASFTASTVVSFEPNPDVLPILERNLNINKIDHTIYRFGLGDENGKFSIHIPNGVEHNIGAAKLVKEKTGLIDVKRLDDIINDIVKSFDIY